MKFKSKIDWWAHIIFALLSAFNLWAVWRFLSADAAGIILTVVLTPLTAFVVIPMWLRTYYEVGEYDIVIKCGLGKGKRIPFAAIKSIAPTRNPESAPALSMDRLIIKYSTSVYNEQILISPAEKEKFIKLAASKNPEIEIHDKSVPTPKAITGLLYFALAILAATVIGTGALFYFGESEPQIIIEDGQIEIRAMFGTTFEIAHISDIALQPQSMREIGSGGRTNGFNGAAWRGNFGAGLLYVRPDSSPTIHITRDIGRDIYISFRDSADTVELYHALTEVSP